MENNFLILLFNIFLFATIVKISTDNIIELIKPFANASKYSFIFAFILSTIGILALNVGVLDLLNIITPQATSWVNVYDLALTSIFITSGAQAIHKLDESIKNYSKKGAE